MAQTRVTPQMAKQFATQYQAGSTIREIAADHGASYGSVYKHLTAQGVQLRRHGGWSRRHPAGAAG